MMSATAAARDDLAAQLRLLQAQDARVAAIGWRLRAENAPLCPAIRPEIGVMLYDAAQFAPEARPVATALFGLDVPVAVAVAVADAPAARAGVAAGDGIIAVAGQPLPRAVPGDAATFDGVEAVLRRIDAAAEAAGAAGAPLSLSLTRAGAARDVAVVPQPVCTALVQLLPDPQSEASADAYTITVSTGLLARVANDDELAFLIAHELAHVMLGHRERLTRARVSKGLFAGFGRNGAILRAVEVDADRLGIVLAARAGYDPFAAATFWRRAGRAAAPLIGDGTHPGWRARGDDAEAAARAIAASGGKPMPPAAIQRQLVDRARQLGAKLVAFDR